MFKRNPGATPRARRAVLLLAAAGAVTTAGAGTAAPASAGSYRVVSCDAAPGGVNRSWRPREDRGMLAAAACPTRGNQQRGLVVRNRVNGGTVRRRKGASLSFEAPPGARLRGVRFDWDGRRVSRGWTIGLAGSDGRLIAGCRGGGSDTRGACALGDPKGARRTYRRLEGRRSVRIVARCEARAGCATNPIGGSADRTRARLAVHDPVVTVVDRSPPSTRARGTALARTWQRGVTAARLTARDNVGIRSTALRVDGITSGSHKLRCAFTRPRPCPVAARRTYRLFTPRYADGKHALVLTAADAAGNLRRVERTLRIDNHAPRRVRNVRVLGGGGLRSRNSFDLRWTPRARQVAPIRRARYRLCRTGQGRRCVTRARHRAVRGINDLSVPGRGEWRFRVWLEDAAGNANAKQASRPVKLRFDHRGVSRLTAAVGGTGKRGRRATVDFGERPVIRGELSDSRGRAVGGARIAVLSRTRGADRARRAGSVRTDSAGRYRYRVRRGPSRTLRFAYRGGASHRPSGARVGLAVRAKSTIVVSRRKVANGDRVRFRGRVLGGGLPANGKLLQLEAFYRGRWRPFEVLRTDRTGRWRHPYRFEATSGQVTYPFRARIPKERGYPYAVGGSRVVRVTVGGR